MRIEFTLKGLPIHRLAGLGRFVGCFQPFKEWTKISFLHFALSDSLMAGANVAVCHGEGGEPSRRFAPEQASQSRRRKLILVHSLKGLKATYETAKFRQAGGFGRPFKVNSMRIWPSTVRWMLLAPRWPLPERAGSSGSGSAGGGQATLTDQS